MSAFVPFVDERKLKEYGGSVAKNSQDIHEISIDDWIISSSHGPIATESEKAALFSSTTVPQSVPEQLYCRNTLCVRHKHTNTCFTFTAKDALEQWKKDDEEMKNPVITIGLSKQWQQERSRILESVKRVSYDWTYTTSYAGTLFDCVPTVTQKQINMRLLTDRSVPILMYDSLPLYVSELDDVGVSEVSVKVRVMPGCWFILLRFFLRIDMQLVKIRDTRYYCEFSPIKEKPLVLRERRYQESNDPKTVASCGDADQAAQVLQALAPVGVTFYSMEEL